MAVTPTPVTVSVEPAGISIRWDDGHTGLYPHRHLRASCRCAACVDESTGRRITGYEDVPEDVEAIDWMQVGRYALRFLWTDMHDTGIYPFGLLRRVCACSESAS